MLTPSCAVACYVRVPYRVLSELDDVGLFFFVASVREVGLCRNGMNMQHLYDRSSHQRQPCEPLSKTLTLYPVPLKLVAQSGQNKATKRPKGVAVAAGGGGGGGGGKQLHLTASGKQLKGKAAAAAAASSPTSPSAAVGHSDGVNPWARCLVDEPPKADAEGGGAAECCPVSTARALFGRGAAMENGLRAALGAEALVLQALVPPR